MKMSVPLLGVLLILGVVLVAFTFLNQPPQEKNFSYEKKFVETTIQSDGNQTANCSLTGTSVTCKVIEYE